MSESTLSVDYTSLYKIVAYALGLGRPATPPLADAADDAEVDDIIQAAYRMYLFPPPVQQPPKPQLAHNWSWLRTSATVSVSGTATVLPDNFGQLIGDAVCGSNTVSRVSVDQLLSLATTGGGSGSTQYIAIRAKAATIPTRWEILGYPGGSVTYLYQILPNALTLGMSAVGPLGGAAYAELLQEACLAVVESRADDNAAPTQHRERFMELLAGLVAMDLEASKISNVKPFPFANNSTSLELGYYDYIREIAGYMDYGWDFASLTGEQQGIVLSILQQGLSQFYWPNIANTPYQWTFLAPEATLSVTAGTSLYALPADFQSLIGDLNWQNTSGAWRTIKVISRAAMDRLRQNRPETNTLPACAAIYAVAPVQSSTGSRWKIQFDNPFDASYSLVYCYRVEPPKLGASVLLPYGGIVHAQTILLSCLCAAERRKEGKAGVQYQAFQSALKSSMDNDSQNRPNHLGEYRDLGHGGYPHGDGYMPHGWRGEVPYYLDGNLVNT